MMRIIRILVRLPLFVLWTLFCCLTALPIRFFLPKKMGFRVIGKYYRIYSRVAAFIFGMKIIVHGDTDCINESGSLVISNHHGYIDIYAHGAIFNMRFVSKKEIRSWPVIGALGHLTIRPIWVDRCSPLETESSLAEMRDCLKTGMSLVIYPEGTSTDGKNGILPFKTTAFETIRGTDIPIQPLITIYRIKDGDSPVCYIGDDTFLPHFLRLFGNRSYECHIFAMQKLHFGNMNRKQMALETHRIMSEEYDRIMK